MSRMTKILAATTALAAMSLSAGAAQAADDKLTIIVGGLEKQIYLPAKLTEQLGYFKDEGLNVELINSRAGVEAENEMLAGVAQGVVGSYDHTIDLQSKGKYLVSIVQINQAPGEVEMVSTKAADIKSPADFKGKTLGITGIGSGTDFMTRYLAVNAGVKVGEFTTLPVGAGNTFIAAMKQGAIQAGMTTEPTISQLIKTGDAKILVDLRTPELTEAAFGGPYPFSSLYVQASWLDTHKDEAQKLANAMVKTLHWISAHSAEEIADKMPKDYYVGDKALYVKGLAGDKAMFTPDGRMPKNGPETVLKILSAFSKSVQGKQIDLSKTYTTAFVDAAAKTTPSN